MTPPPPVEPAPATKPNTLSGILRRLRRHTEPSPANEIGPEVNATSLPDHLSPATINTATAADTRPSRLRRNVGKATTTVLMAATGASCTFTGGGHHAEKPSGTRQEQVVPSPSDSVADAIHTRFRIENLIIGSGAKPAEARILLDKLPQNQRPQEISTAVDLADASDAVTKTSAYTWKPSQARHEIEDIANPDAKTPATKAIDILDASQTASGLSAYTIKPEEARKEIESIADATIRQQADKVVDSIIASHTVTGVKILSVKPDEALQAINLIKDPAIRDQAQKGVVAQIILQGVRSYDAKVLADAQTQLAGITDLDLRRIAEDALKQRIQGNGPTFQTSELSRFADKTQSGLSRNSTSEIAQLLDQKSQVSQITKKLRDDMYDQLKLSSKAIQIMVHDHNNLSADVVKPLSISTLPDPGASVDLSTAKGTKKVLDLGHLQDMPTDVKEIDQFAEFFVEDGTLQLRFEANNGLKPEAMGQITGLMNELGPLFYAGFASGDLLSVRFIVGDEYNPYYLPTAREIHVILPKDASTSIDQLRSGLVHEETHALTRRAFSSDADIKPEEVSKLVKACETIRATAYNAAEARFRTMPEILGNLRAQAHSEDQQVIDFIIQKAQQGTLDQFLKNRFGQYSDEYANDCLERDLKSVIDDAAYQLRIDPNRLSYLKDTDPYKKAAGQWYVVQRYYSVFDKINESNLVTTNYVDKDTLGHSEENVKELVGSILDDAISWPQQFGQVLRMMSPEDKDAAIQAFQMSVDLVVNRDESLRGPLSTYEAIVLTIALQT